jgi:CubicO group peptidase (beta-lactamase class C family)
MKKHTSNGSSPPRATWSGAALKLVILIILMAVNFLHPRPTAAAHPHAATPDFAAIDRYIESEMQATRLPGLALGIVQGDRIVHLKGFGRADPSGRAVTPQTPFLIASVTKSFTALAVMQLVEARQVELDAPIQRYLPWFRVADEAASARITVRQLLNHTSGLPTLAGHEDMVFDSDLGEEALEERVRALRTTRLTAPPGEVFQYSNAGYATLALLVQTVSGQSYERYLQQHIYAPLQMRRSFVSKPEAQRHGMATGYRYWFGRPVPYDWSYSYAELGAGFTISSAEDLAHYLIAQLNGGRFGNARVLSPEGIAEMHRPAAGNQVIGQSFTKESYGMGWFVRETEGVRMVTHSGVAPNFHAELVLVPEGKWGIVLLMNGENNLQPARISGMASGVTGLLVGKELPAFVTPNDLKPTLLKFVLLVGGIQMLGMIWSVAVLRRWRSHPERRPQGWLRVGLHLVPPIVLNLLWGLVCLVGLPRAFFWPLSYLVFEVPDLGYALVLSGAVALSWGVLRPVLLFWFLHTPGVPTATGAPATV